MAQQVKLPLVMTASHTGMPTDPRALELHASTLGRQQTLVEVPGLLLPMWDAWMEAKAPDFGLSYTWPLWPSGE